MRKRNDFSRWSVVDVLLDLVDEGRVVDLVLIELEDGGVVLVKGDFHDVRMAVVVVERVALIF